MAKPRGRPRKPNTANHQITVRCTDQELEGWRKAASHAGFEGNVAGWVRSVLNVQAAVEIADSFPALTSGSDKTSGFVAEFMNTKKDID